MDHCGVGRLEEQLGRPKLFFVSPPIRDTVLTMDCMTQGKHGRSGSKSASPALLALPPIPFDPQEGDVVRYSGKGGSQLVTVHKIHRNVPQGEQPYLDVILPGGQHRDTTMDRIAPK